MVWTFRNIAIVCASAIVGIVLALALALILSTSKLHHIILNLAQVTNQVNMTQELEGNILIHSRESLLWNLTDANVHLLKRDEARAAFEAWFGQSLATVDDAEQKAQLERIGNAAKAYFDVRTKYEQQESSAVTIAAEVSPYTDALMAALNTYTSKNMSEINAAVDSAKTDDTKAVTTGIVALMVASTGLALLFAFLRKQIYRPLNQVVTSINSLATGKNIPLDKPMVLDIATIWNALTDSASRLQRQRDTQLRYLAAVAHDLRNPISAIKSSTDLLADSSNEENKEIIGIIDRQIDYLSKLLNDFLDITRAEAGTLALKIEPGDLCQSVRDVVILFSSYSKNHTIDLAEPPSQILAKFDKLRVSQVLNNLVSNAIKYTPYGGTISVSINQSGDQACIRIKDHGIGIDSDEIKTIFEPFRRSRQTKDIIPGVGLGLFTSQKIVHSHGGYMEVESQKGVGSVFSVFLPLSGPPSENPN